MHSLNENVDYSTLGNLNGMGAVQAAQPAGTPGLVWGDYGMGSAGGIGSGDIGQNLLPVSMKIAAQTIGLDLVAVKLASSPKVDLLFVDFKYDNLADSTLKDERPIMFALNISDATAKANLNTALKNSMALKLDANSQPVREKVGGLTNPIYVHLSGGTLQVQIGNTTGDLSLYFDKSGVDTAAELNAFDPSLVNYAANAAAPKKEGVMEFLGWSRINGYPMFRVFRQFNPGANNAGWGFVDDRNTFPTAAFSIADMLNNGVKIQVASGSTLQNVAIRGATVELVSLMEDHIPGFSAGLS